MIELSQTGKESNIRSNDHLIYIDNPKSDLYENDRAGYVVKIETEADLSSEDEILFDSIAVHFSVLIFFKQFFIHLTAPFFIFLGNPVNQNFFHFTPIAIFYNIFTSLCFFVMIITAFMGFGTQLKANNALWMPFLYYCLHKFQIGVKYATLSPTEYHRFMTVSLEISQKYQTQLMLVTGWLGRPIELVEFEMSAAAMRCGVDINNMHFVVPDPKSSNDNLSQYRNWRALLLGKQSINDSDECPDMKLQPDGSYQVSAFRACIAVLRQTDQDDPLISKIISVVIYLLTTFNAAIPLLLIPISTKLSTSDIIFYIASTILNLTYCQVIINFMFVVIYDVIRGRKGFHYIRRMMRLTDFEYDKRVIRLGRLPMREIDKFHSQKERDNINRYIKHVTSSKSDGESKRSSTKSRNKAHSTAEFHTDEIGLIHVKEEDFAHIPRISVKYESNVMVWAYTRLMLQNFGDRFRFRLDVFIGIISVLVLILAAIALLIAFAADQTSLFYSAFFLQILLAVVLVLSLLISVSFEGSRWNDELERNRGAVAAHVLKIASRKIKLVGYLEGLPVHRQEDEEKHEKLLTVLERRQSTLESCMDIIEVNNIMKPFVLLGIPASPALTSTLIGGAVTFFSAIISAYSSVRDRKI